MRDETKCLHSGYTPENGGPGVMPIVQSTTYRFNSTKHVADLFDMPTECMYSRFANPTVEAVEKKIADLEGGVGAMCTSSGQAASLMSIMNICKAGDHVVASAAIYGGTFNLFNKTLRDMGIDFTFVPGDATEEELKAAIKDNTKAFFTETLTTVHLPAYLNYNIVNGVFDHCPNLKTITIDDSNQYFTVADDGLLYLEAQSNQN